MVWDPDRYLFVIPVLNHPVTWYGFLFAVGFLSGYFLVRALFMTLLFQEFEVKERNKATATHLADLLTLFVMVGTLIGARLGHVFFYGWSYYRAHPVDIFKIWEGGLASHGGAFGIMVALLCFFFLLKPRLTGWSFWTLLDVMVIPAAWVGCLIRVGNFINQEIIGIPTRLPWGVRFGHPLEIPALNGSSLTLHPVQLYEALFYLLLFICFLLLWRLGKLALGTGKCAGLFFLLVFSFRFAIEPLKMAEEPLFQEGWLRMGQLLSLPFIVLGATLLLRTKWINKAHS